MELKLNRQKNSDAATLVLTLLALAGALTSLGKNVVAFGTLPGVSSSPLPVGTIIPVRLDKTLSLDGANAGQEIEAKLMQDLPLPNRKKIRMGADVSGTVLSLNKSADGSGVELTLQFNRIEYEKKMIPVLTSLRAIASFQAVRTAQASFGGPDGGTPSGWADTVQIGGDIRYGDGGEVRNLQKQKVGKGVLGGVLVHIQANPGAGCSGPEKGNDTLQALWVFSADACGAYDLRGVQIAHSGNAKPTGAITLRFEKSDMKLDASTAVLLRVVAP